MKNVLFVLGRFLEVVLIAAWFVAAFYWNNWFSIARVGYWAIGVVLVAVMWHIRQRDKLADRLKMHLIFLGLYLLVGGIVVTADPTMVGEIRGEKVRELSSGWQPFGRFVDLNGLPSKITVTTVYGQVCVAADIRYVNGGSLQSYLAFTTSIRYGNRGDKVLEAALKQTAEEAIRGSDLRFVRLSPRLDHPLNPAEAEDWACMRIDMNDPEADAKIASVRNDLTVRFAKALPDSVACKGLTFGALPGKR